MGCRNAIRVLIVALLLASCGTTMPTPTRPAAGVPTAPAVVSGAVPDCPSAAGPVTGAIVFGAANNLLAIDPGGGAPAALTNVPQGTRVLEPDWSPDGQTLAFIFSYPSPYPLAQWLLSSKICALDRATGQARTLASPPSDTAALEDVSWAPDGKALLVTLHEYTFDQQGVMLTETINVARYDLQASSFISLVRDGRAPMLSPDGAQLSYVYMDPATYAYSLRASDPAGQDTRVITTSADIQGTINAPRWSPDGKELLFSVSSLLGSPGAITPQPSGSLLDQLLGVEVASAHGLPADIWAVSADGSSQRRITSVGLDDPRFDWDPAGGRIIYVSGFGGLTLVNLADGSSQRITDAGDYGGISWRG